MKTEHVKSWFMKKYIIFKEIDLFNDIIILNFICFNFFIFAPIEIILTNKSEFWFEIKTAFPIFLFSFLSFFVLNFSLCFFKNKKNNKIITSWIFLEFIISVALFFQGSFLFNSYGKMDGTPIDWAYFTKIGVLNSCVLIIFFVIASILFIKNILNKKRITLISGIFFVMQIITLIFLSSKTINYVEVPKFAMTSNEQFLLSQNKKNIIVIVADGFDGNIFEKILDEEKSFREKFNDFTFYKDTCGTSLNTEESIITLLTGNQLIRGPSFSENIKNAYSNSKIYDILNDNNYKTYIFSSDSKMISESVINNIENAEYFDLGFSDKYKAFKLIYRIVAFKYFPHFLKKFFFYSTMELDDLKSTKNVKHFSSSNLLFRESVKSINKYETSFNVYQFFHIQGPHSPAVMDRYCNALKSPVKHDSAIQLNDAMYEQAVGVIRIFTELILNLREKNIYDNTTIILTADHGWNNRANPLLLIKRFDERKDMLDISYKPVSMLKDYMSSFEYIVSGKKNSRTLFDLSENETRLRPFYVYEYDLSHGDRRFSKKDTYYFKNGELFDYRKPFSIEEDVSDVLEKKIDILNKVFSPINLKGFYSAESRFVWCKRDAQVILKNKIISKNGLSLNLYISPHSYTTSTKLKIYVNDVIVSDFIPDKPGDYNFYFSPQEICSFNDIYKIDINYDSSFVPKELGMNNDTRDLSFQVSYIGEAN